MSVECVPQFRSAHREAFSVESSSPSTPWQFSLRHLFIAMTVLAAGCSLAMLMPVGLSHLVIGLFWMIALSVLTVGVVFGRGDRRAFCIGALIVSSSVWTNVGGRFMQGIHYIYDGVSLPVMLWLDLGVLSIAALANGWLCVQARRYFDR
jgi:hypothetical protein